MGRLDGKVALISGGARGQGAVEALMFVREGAAVVLGDVLDDEGSACAVSRWGAWERRKRSPTACSTSRPTSRRT